MLGTAGDHCCFVTRLYSLKTQPSEPPMFFICITGFSSFLAPDNLLLSQQDWLLFFLSLFPEVLVSDVYENRDLRIAKVL